jgi:calcium/calmodulin-dependent protein kinase I
MGCVGSKEKKNKTDGKPASNSNANAATDKPQATTQSATSNDPKGNNSKIDQNATSLSVDSAFKVGDEIGRGAFSIVKRGVNRKTAEEVAIKFIEKKFVDKQDLMLLAREIDIMKKVDHANVLKLKEVFETDETIALVMELVTGGELFYKIVEKGSYSERDAANIVAQMINGVDYLHDKGIAHRDLKPENLLCSGESDPSYKPFRVVIADFGLSKIFDSGEALETSCGTPDYVAPEVITAEGSYDKSVDMWSCGVITYVLLCGFSPFLSSTQTGLFEKIIKCEYDFPDPEWTNISEEAKDFIRHLLVKDPKDRWTAKQCKQHPWLSGAFGGSDSLAGGKIADKMAAYNQKRKDERKGN